MNLRRAEPWLALALALALFAAHAATFRLHPAVGDDDVLLSDAGVNLALGHGFTSSAWPGQSKEEIFSGNLPLYPLCLSAWVRLAGFGLPQLRAFSYLCGSVALLCTWWALRRRAWIAAPAMRLACVAVMFASGAVSMAVRRNRYDAFQLLLCALLLCVWASAVRRPLKLLLLTLLGVLIAAAGFQVAAFIGLVCLGAVAWEYLSLGGPGERSAFQQAAAVIAGLGAGAGLVLGVYWQAGVLHGLLENVAWGRSLDAAVPAPAHLAHLNRLVFETLRDTVMLPCFLVLLGCAALTRRRHTRREAIAAIVLTSVVMVGLEAAIHFAAYYRWMTAGLLIVLTFRVWENAAPELSRFQRGAGALLLFSIALAGLPRMVIGSSLLLPYGPQSRRFEEIARAHLRSTDVVFADYQAYCAVKPLCAQAYFPGYLGRMSPEEQTSVNVVMVREKHPYHWYIIHFGEYLDRFTRQGKWERVAAAPLERTRLSSWLARWFPRQIELMEYNSGVWELCIYRRIERVN